MIDPSPVEGLPDQDESGPDAGEGDTYTRGRVIRRILVALGARRALAALAACGGLSPRMKSVLRRPRTWLPRRCGGSAGGYRSEAQCR